MTRTLSNLISWATLIGLVIIPSIALYYLANIDAFAVLARRTLNLSVRWETVEAWQWYALWGVTVLYLMIGWVGLFFLRRAFLGFAGGEFFNTGNSRSLRSFAVMMLVQAIMRPVHMALVSVILSANHPAGEKMLAISVGSNELKLAGLALIFLVISNLLVEGARLDAENKQFV